MYESFVFHADFIETLPDDKKSEWCLYIANYGIYGIEPSLSGFELIYWSTIKKRIDIDKINYESACLKQKINAINVRVKNNKASDNDLTNLDLFKTKLNELNENKKNISFKTKLNELNEVKRTHHDNDIDIDIEFDNEFDIDIDNDIDAAKLPDKNPPSQKILSDSIFNLLKDASLPCCKNNPVTFYLQDYANAMRYIHSNADYKALHSDDLIGAVKNYILVLKDSDSYISSKMNLYSLVKSKIFYNLLPSNFDADSFKKFGTEKTEKKSIIKAYSSVDCPYCHKNKIYCSDGKYYCDDCGEVSEDDAFGKIGEVANG